MIASLTPEANVSLRNLIPSFPVQLDDSFHFTITQVGDFIQGAPEPDPFVLRAF